MRQHTVAGERIIASSEALTAVAPLVRSSHERWDGSGYPDALAGEAIPRGARIIAVCDAYHAMTSDRSYRKAMSAEVALAELRSGAGTQFDPEVVAAFLRRQARDAAHRPYFFFFVFFLLTRALPLEVLEWPVVSFAVSLTV